MLVCWVCEGAGSFAGGRPSLAIYVSIDALGPVKDLIFLPQKMKEMEISGGNSTYNMYLKVDGAL